MTKSLRIVVLVSGRGSNLQALIDAQLVGKIRSQIVAVISNITDAPALERARRVKIPALVVASKGKNNDIFFNELQNEIKKYNPDLIVLAGFMKILAPSLVKAYANRIINIHPSLLPSFCGLHAQQQAIDAGVKITGCTVHFVDEGCDTGPIIMQRAIDIKSNDSQTSLSDRLLAIEHQVLVAAIKLIEDDKLVLQGKKTLLSGEPTWVIKSYFYSW